MFYVYFASPTAVLLEQIVEELFLMLTGGETWVVEFKDYNELILRALKVQQKVKAQRVTSNFIEIKVKSTVYIGKKLNIKYRIHRIHTTGLDV